MKSNSFAALLFLLSFGSINCAQAGVDRTEPKPGVLRASFIDINDRKDDELSKACVKPGTVNKQDLVTDVVVGLAGTVAESLINLIAAKAQPEATTLQTVFPLEGFYFGDKIAIDHGCLIFHNGSDDKGTNATLVGVLQAYPSVDGSAFRFVVREWKFTHFIKAHTDRIAQKKGLRDIALSIEFLSPSSDSLGQKAVFIERTFNAVTQEAMAGAFKAGDKLPWFAAPASQKGEETGLHMPLNIRLTIVETTKPNQFAVWLAKTAEDKKAEISTLVQNAVRESIDPNFAATEAARRAEAAGTAYGAYKSAWDALAALHVAKPKEPSGQDSNERAAYEAALKVWNSNMAVQKQVVDAKRQTAKSAFSTADLKWPGDFPPMPE